MKYFDENIIALINLLEYEFYIVTHDEHIDCVCRSFETKQGNPACPHCLGIGKKAKIKKVKGVRQPGSEGAGSISVNVETGIYFFKEDYKLKENDYIVWHNEVEQVVKVERHISDSMKPVYFRCETRRKKADTEIFLKNFCKAIGKKYEKR